MSWTSNPLFPSCFRKEMKKSYSPEKSALIFSSVRAKKNFHEDHTLGTPGMLSVATSMEFNTKDDGELGDGHRDMFFNIIRAFEKCDPNGK